MHVLKMDMPDEKGVTHRDQLMQVIQSAPEDSEIVESAISELEETPEIPFYIEHIWEWFWQLHKGRTFGMSGPNPLTWENVLAWKHLLEIQIRPIEIEILYEIDSVYLKYVADENKRKK